MKSAEEIEILDERKSDDAGNGASVGRDPAIVHIDAVLKLYHGTNQAEKIMREGFLLLDADNNDSSFVGDNFVEGIYLSPTLDPYKGDGQLSDIRNVIEVGIPPNLNMLRLANYEQLRKLYEQYSLIETDSETPAQLTVVLRNEGRDGVQYQDEIIVFDPSAVKPLRIVPDDLLEDSEITEVTLYHGSNSAVDRFDNDKVGTGEGGNLFGEGFYLTDNKDIAMFYALAVAKKEFIKEWKPTGILKSLEPVYIENADELANKNVHISEFRVKGKILDASSFIIDEKFKRYLLYSYVKHSGFEWSSAEKTVDYLKDNKTKIDNYRGELEYVIRHIAAGDKEIVNDIVNYIKELGYDGIKYESDKSYEGKGSFNYVIYNENIIQLTQPQLLYHGTSLNNATEIIKNNGFVKGVPYYDVRVRDEHPNNNVLDSVWVSKDKLYAANYADETVNTVPSRVIHFDSSLLKIAGNDKYKEYRLIFGSESKHELFKEGYDGAEINEDDPDEIQIWNYEKLRPIKTDIVKRVGYDNQAGYPQYEYTADWKPEQESKSQTMKTIILEPEINVRYVRLDDNNRKIFKAQNGTMYVDVEGQLHSMTDRGEPNYPVHNLKIINEPSAESGFETTQPPDDKYQFTGLKTVGDAKSNYELMVNDTWFNHHPDKVLGEEYERPGKFGPEKAIRGTIENLSRIDADLQTEQVVSDQPLETVIMPTAEQEMDASGLENIKKSISRSKVDYTERKISGSSNENEMHSFDEILNEYNGGITEDDIRAFVWYKSHIGDPLGGNWKRFSLPASEIEQKKEQWRQSGILCRYKGDFMPSFIYYAENIYERISDLRSEEQVIVETFGKEQFDKQLDGLEKIKPPMLTLTAPVSENENRRLTLLPISKFAQETFITELRDGTTFENYDSQKRENVPGQKSLVHAFEAWLEALAPSEFKHSSNRYEIVAHYLENRSFSRGTEKEEKLRVQQRAKMEGNRLFTKFLAEALTLNDQAKIEYKWNSIYNGYVDVDYNKVPVGFQISKFFQKERLFIRPEKREGVAFTFTNGSSCIAYDVGVGKTITALFTMAQFLEAGYAKRILVVVPNQTYQQWIQECKGKIVDGKVIYNGVLPQIPINDFYNLGSGYSDKVRDKEGKIQMVQEGSITFITYEGLEQIGVSANNEEYFSKFIYDIINQGTEQGRELAALMEQVDKAIGKGLRNTIFNIEDFGFDFVCFDEAHKMKKSFTQVKGAVSETGKREDSRYQIKSGKPSDIAIKGLMIAQFIFQNNNNRNVMLLTATPFTNSPLEVFSMLALIGYQRLKKEGLNNINEFFNTFVKTSTELVISPRLKPERKEIVLGFNNLITLQQLIYRFINYKTGEDVKIERPNKIVLPLFNRKNPVSGQLESLPADQQVSSLLPMTSMQQQFMGDIERYIRGEADLGQICNPAVLSEMPEEENETTATSGVVLNEANLSDEEKAGVRVLRGLSYARLVALSPYLYPCSFLGEPDYKEYVNTSPKFTYVMECIRSVKKHHDENGEPMSGQIIYMNTGIDYFSLLKKYLVYELGFLESEIGIIRSGMSATAKNNIKDKFNDGKIHVVIGSATIKEGINLQKRSTVLYNCYLDWNPTDIKQLEGRLWRFGNEFENVRIANPLVENSIDSFIFQKLEEKTSRINEIWTRTNRENDLKLEEFNPTELKMGLITDPKALAELQLLQTKEQLEDQINGIETEINMVEGFADAKKEFDSNISEFTEVVDRYRPATVNKETGKRAPRKLNTKISLFEDILKTSVDSEGNHIYLDYSERALLDAIKDANRTLMRVERTYLIPKGLSASVNIEELSASLKLQIENIQKQIEEQAGPDAVKKLADEIAKKRKEQNMKSASVEDRVKEFTQLNHLLSVKKVYGTKNEIIPQAEHLLAIAEQEWSGKTCPPILNDGKRDTSPAALHYLQKCIDKEPQTRNTHSDKTGNYTVDRKLLHDSIISKFSDQKPCVQERPIAVLTGGPPGAGKSRFLKTHAKWLLGKDVYHIDADEMKTMFPEYKGWNASKMHQETKDIIDRLITEIGVPCKHDLVYDGTMNKAKNYLPLIDRLKQLGYDVFIIYLSVPHETSRSRVLERYQRTGRYVPMEVIDEVYEMGTDAYDMLKTKVDGYIKIDGITNEVIEQGGVEIPASRNYKLSDGSGKVTELSTDNRKKSYQEAIDGYKQLIKLTTDQKKKKTYREAVDGYQTLLELLK